MQLQGTVLVPGSAEGPLLRLDRPISFWGGVDPTSGAIIDPSHPNHGGNVAGQVLAIPATIGSSSSSAIILELLRVGNAPRALVLGNVDAILTLGVVVAGEMDYPTIPVIHVPPIAVHGLPSGGTATVSLSGSITVFP